MSDAERGVATVYDFELTSIEASVPRKNFKGLGEHWMIDFQNCRQLPDDPEPWSQWMEEAAVIMGCTVINSMFHRFSPYGISGVVVVAESHLAVHTWPEYDSVCVDFFTCSDQMIPLAGIAFLGNKLQASSADVQQLSRGKLPPR